MARCLLTLPGGRASCAPQVLPLSLIFVGMITFNNMCLMYVEVSFYNVARSLTIVFNVVFTYLLLRASTSNMALGALFVVVLGFLIGSEGEVNFSLLGTSFGVLSSVFVSLNSIYTKKVMPHVGDDMWVLAFYNNCIASVLFVPCMLFTGELETLLAYASVLVHPVFWGVMLLAGGLGFAIGIVTMMQIQATTPLTHNVSGTAKACAQSILAFWLWGNPMTFGALLGMSLVLGGSLLYAVIRLREGAAADAAKAAAAARQAQFDEEAGDVPEESK